MGWNNRYRRSKKGLGRHGVSLVNPKDAWARIEGVAPAVSGEISVAGKIRKKLLAKKNYGEIRAMALLKPTGVLYDRERMVKHRGRMYFIDFMITKVCVDGAETPVSVCLEIDGSSHNNALAIQSDKVKDAALVSAVRNGSVLRITVPRLRRMTSDDLVSAIVKMRPGLIKRLK